MLSEDRFGMMPLWNHLLYLLSEIDSICKRHKLRYYVTDGNALGAVRHKGFIPWDDDLDISMPRPDYEQFCRFAKDELPHYLKVVNWQTTPEFFFLFGKVQDTRPEKVHEIEQKIKMPLSNGLFIDIFPIDGYPETTLSRLCLKFQYLFLRPIHRYRMSPYGIQSRKGKLLWLFGMVLSAVVPSWRRPGDMMSKMQSLVTRFPYDSSRLTGRTCSRMTILQRKPVDKSIWGNGVLMEFHDTQVVVPSDVDAHLKSEFGDYMRLPPIEKQCPTHSYSYDCPWKYGPRERS